MTTLAFVTHCDYLLLNKLPDDTLRFIRDMIHCTNTNVLQSHLFELNNFQIFVSENNASFVTKTNKNILQWLQIRQFMYNRGCLR